MHNDPHGARIDVRNATYANRLAEETEIQRVDDIIWDRVAVLEESTVANARVTIGKQTEQIESAETLATESRHLRYALEEGSITPTEAAESYRRLRSLAGKTQATLARLDEASEVLEGNANDPYAHYLRITAKLPTLRPSININGVLG